MTVQITWLGHAAFLVEGDGRRILLDPYRAPDAGKYGAIDIDADIILASHINDRYHSHWEAARGTPHRLNGLTLAHLANGLTVNGLTFRAVQVWENDERDTPVSMPYFTLGGLSICHMGDLGHALTPEEAAPIAGCDVLLAVAGGPPTLSLSNLGNAIALIQPRIVIPMHYQTGRVNLPLQSLPQILEALGQFPVIYSSSSTVTLSLETLASQTTLVILPPAL